MEELKKLADILEDVKTKISDEEYKQILETSQKIYKKQKRQYVKCIIHHTGLFIYIKDDVEDTEFVFKGDGFKFERDEASDESLKIFIDKHCETETYIFEVEPNCDDKCQCHEFNIKNKTMNMNFYNKLKADKIRVGHSGLKDDVIIFMNDM
tara:strand:- start:72 stop:527 length:456 start_codon:yes stop_codon:yes gene_type:complete